MTTNRFLGSGNNVNDYARENTLEAIEEQLVNGTINVSIGSGTANDVDIIHVNGVATSVDQGNSAVNTLRVAICDDDTNLSNIAVDINNIDSVLLTDIPNVIGTQSSAAPTNMLICGGVDEKTDCAALSLNATRYLATSLRSLNGAAGPISTDNGVSGTQTIRVVNASDDVNLSAINTSTTDIPNVISSNNGAVPTRGIQIAGLNSAAASFEFLESVDGNLFTDLRKINNQTIATNSGVLSAGTQRVTEATDSQLNTNITAILADTATIDTNVLSSIEDTLFYNNYYSTTHPIYTIHSKLGNFGSADTIYRVPFNDTGISYKTIEGTETLVMSSTDSGDQNCQIYIEGYDVNGDRISQRLTTNAGDGQIKSGGSSTDYCSITRFSPAQDMSTLGGTFYLYKSSIVPVAGVPSEYYCKFVGPSGNNDSLIHWINLPNNKSFYLNKLIIRKLAGIYNHRLLFIRGEKSTNTFQSGEYRILFEVLCDKSYIEIKDMIFRYPINATNNAMVFGVFFKSNATASDTAAEIDVSIDFSIIDR